jgi:hypothetical protein
MTHRARAQYHKQKIVKGLNLNRISRAYLHYQAIKDELPNRTQKERDETTFFTRKLERYYRQAQRLLTLRVVFSSIFYASIIIPILKLIPILQFLVAFIEIGSALVVPGAAFIAMMILSLQINLKLQLMNQCLVHLTALYQSNPKRNTDATIKALRKTL